MFLSAVKSICCQCQFMKCKLYFPLHVISLKFPPARLQNESVGITLIQQHIYESEEAQTDESFFPVCLMNVCMIKLSLKAKVLGFSSCLCSSIHFTISGTQNLTFKSRFYADLNTSFYIFTICFQ